MGEEKQHEYFSQRNVLHPGGSKGLAKFRAHEDEGSGLEVIVCTRTKDGRRPQECLISLKMPRNTQKRHGKTKGIITTFQAVLDT